MSSIVLMQPTQELEFEPPTEAGFYKDGQVKHIDVRKKAMSTLIHYIYIPNFISFDHSYAFIGIQSNLTDSKLGLGQIRSNVVTLNDVFPNAFIFN